MDDPIAILRDRTAKAEAKVAKLEKALETAKNELHELVITSRVMAEISGESPVNVGAAAPSVAVAERQALILARLGVGRESANAPAEIYKEYIQQANEDITIDTFRTTIWRMADNEFSDMFGRWIVKRDSVGYWKESALPSAQEAFGENEAPNGKPPEPQKPAGWKFPQPQPAPSNPNQWRGA